MTTLCFTSFTYSYANRARVLFDSIKKYHPEWETAALITDRLPNDKYAAIEFTNADRVVFSDQLDIPKFQSWLFGHNLVEACTAVKGPFLYQELCSGKYDKVIYLDPDTCVFSRMDDTISCLDEYSIVLTPHQLQAGVTAQEVRDNEITSLMTGIYNLGFIGVAADAEGLKFAEWWCKRLLQFCHDDIPNGLFVDQRWCDHVPSLFERVKINKDPGYNVASWNISRRNLLLSTDGHLTVNGKPLKFCHFTKIGSVGDVMIRRNAGANYQVSEVWKWYNKQLKDNTPLGLPPRYWNYSSYADGTIIDDLDRRLYRSRRDLQNAFRQPFGSDFKAWVTANVSKEKGSSGLT